MDERMLDDKESERLKGRILTDDGEEETVVELNVPEIDEKDEDLIGLSQEEYVERLKQRKLAEEEAKRERDAMLKEGESSLKKGDYTAAEGFFSQALVFDADCRRAHEGVWICRTKEFTETKVFYKKKYAREISGADEYTRAFVLKNIGERLQEERAQVEAEAAPLKERVETAQAERRESFRNNRNYYFARFCALFILFGLMLIGVGVSVHYINRTREMIPVFLAIAFGALALLFLVLWIVYIRKLLVAQRLCMANEKLSSTEDGARLKELLKQLEYLNLVLDGQDE